MAEINVMLLKKVIDLNRTDGPDCVCPQETLLALLLHRLSKFELRLCMQLAASVLYE